MLDFFIVGVIGFEPTISRPPDVHFNRTKLHPDGDIKCKCIILLTFRYTHFFFCSVQKYIIHFGYLPS